MASCEGRKPRIPQYDAGTLTLPPVSVPMIKRRTFWFNLLRTSQETYKLSTKESHLRRNQQALTATADPLEDPPGTRSGTHGFLGVP
jgi:hypothetical protein